MGGYDGTVRFDTKIDETGLKTGLTKLKGAIAALGITASLAAVTAGFVKIGKASVLAASEAEETTNKFNVTFSSIASEANAAAESLSSSFGLSSQKSKQLLSDTGDLLTGFGFTQKSALNLSDQVNQLAVDLASFTNYAGGAEGASAALTSGLLGEREAMKSLGIAITEADIKQLAEDKGIVGELDRQTKAMLTLELATMQSKNAIGDFARSEASFANQTRIARAGVDDMRVAIGEGLLPLANLAVTTFNDMSGSALDAAEGFSSFVRSADGADKISTILGTIGGSLSAIGEALSIFRGDIEDGLDGAFDPLVEVFGDLSESAAESGVAFDIFGGVVQFVSSFIRILTTAIREQIDFIVQFGTTVVDTGELAVEALKSIWNKEIRDDLREKAREVRDEWIETGADFLDVYAETFDAIKTEAISFSDNARESADRMAEAYERGFTRVKEASEDALLGADGGPDTSSAEEQADAEFQVWYDAWLKEQEQRLAFEEETRQILEKADADRAAKEKQALEELNEKRMDSLQGWSDYASSVAGIFSNLIMSMTAGGEELTESQRKQLMVLFRMQQIANIAQITMDTAVAIMKGFAELGPIGGKIAQVTTALLGATQIAVVASAKPSFEVGAWNIPGEMTATLHPGETVLPAPFAEDYRRAVMSGGGGTTNSSVNVYVSGVVGDIEDVAVKIHEATELARQDGYLQ